MNSQMNTFNQTSLPNNTSVTQCQARVWVDGSGNNQCSLPAGVTHIVLLKSLFLLSLFFLSTPSAFLLSYIPLFNVNTLPFLIPTLFFLLLCPLLPLSFLPSPILSFPSCSSLSSLSSFLYFSLLILYLCWVGVLSFFFLFLFTPPVCR
jgi:hypothetical protein